MKYAYPLTAIDAGGNTRLFYDAETFIAFAYDRQNGGVGGYWRETYYGWSYDKPRRLTRLESDWGVGAMNGATNRWIVRDNCGRVVDKEHLGPDRSYFYYSRRSKEVAIAMEKGLPIPGTRRRWRSSKKWTKNGRNGAHNQRKGIRLYEDPLISNRDFDQL